MYVYFYKGRGREVFKLDYWKEKELGRKWLIAELKLSRSQAIHDKPTAIWMKKAKRILRLGIMYFILLWLLRRHRHGTYEVKSKIGRTEVIYRQYT